MTDEQVEPAATERPLTAVRWGVGGALALTGVTMGITLAGGALGSLLRFAAGEAGLSRNVQSVVLGTLLLAAYALVIGIVWLIGFASGEGFSGSVALKPVPVVATLGLALAVALSGRLMTAVYGLVLQAFGVELPGADADPTRLFPPGPLGVVLMVIVVCLVAPVAEEMVFRGVLLSALSDRWSETLAIGVSSAVFAVVHVIPYAIPPIFVFALILGRVFTRSRSLWVPIAAHAMFNAIGLLAVFAIKAVGVQ